MDTNTFWRIVDRARAVNPVNPEVEAAAKLSRLSLEQIVAFEDIFDQMTNAAYTMDLWGAAYTINGGASDDGFYYFRCWLIGMGRDIYGKAMADPDTLADVVSPTWDAEGIDAEAEIYAAAHRAWMQVTGQPDTAPYPTRSETTALVGQDWDFDDAELMRRKLPRLSAMYEGRYER